MAQVEFEPSTGIAVQQIRFFLGFLEILLLSPPLLIGFYR